MVDHGRQDPLPIAFATVKRSPCRRPGPCSRLVSRPVADRCVHASREFLSIVTISAYAQAGYNRAPGARCTACPMLRQGFDDRRRYRCRRHASRRTSPMRRDCRRVCVVTVSLERSSACSIVVMTMLLRRRRTRSTTDMPARRAGKRPRTPRVLSSPLHLAALHGRPLCMFISAPDHDDARVPR
jgi:hypothetical protein